MKSTTRFYLKLNRNVTKRNSFFVIIIVYYVSIILCKILLSFFKHSFVILILRTLISKIFAFDIVISNDKMFSTLNWNKTDNLKAS